MGAAGRLISVAALIFHGTAALPVRGPLDTEQRRMARLRIRSRFNTSRGSDDTTQGGRLGEATCSCMDPMSYLKGKNTYYCTDGTLGQCGTDGVCYGRNWFPIDDVPKGCKVRDYNVWIEEQFLTCSDEHLIVKLNDAPLEDCTIRCDRTPPCQYVFDGGATCSLYTLCQQKRIPPVLGTTLVKIPLEEREATPAPTESPTLYPTLFPTTSPTRYETPFIERLKILEKPPQLLMWVIPASVLIPLASVWCGAGLFEKAAGYS